MPVAEIYPGAVRDISRYESGAMSGRQIVSFVSRLVKSGLIDHLQGHYHRLFERLVADGYLDEGGNILHKPLWLRV